MPASFAGMSCLQVNRQKQLIRKPCRLDKIVTENSCQVAEKHLSNVGRLVALKALANYAQQGVWSGRKLQRS